MLPATATVSACIVDMSSWRGEELLSAVDERGLWLLSAVCGRRGGAVVYEWVGEGLQLPSAVGGRGEGLSVEGGRVEGLSAVGGRVEGLLPAVGGRVEGLLPAVGGRWSLLLFAVGGRQEGLLTAVDGWVLSEVGGRGEGRLSAAGGRGEGLGECWSILSSRCRKSALAPAITVVQDMLPMVVQKPIQHQPTPCIQIPHSLCDNPECLLCE